jgi:glycosyltransferase involved in cell wall biosynthesis
MPRSIFSRKLFFGFYPYALFGVLSNNMYCEISYNIDVKNKRHLVSVILPWHRSDSLLTKAIESVKNSLNVKIQLILVDDRRTPVHDKWGIASQLRTYGKGYEYAINSAKEFIEGDFTSLMNSDDLLSPHKLYKQIEDLRRNDTKLSITRLTEITARGSLKTGKKMNSSKALLTRESLLFSSFLANASWLADSTYWKERIDFQKCGNGSDWMLAANLSQDIEKWSYLDQELYFYRQHSNQITSTKHSIDDSLLLAWRNLNQELALPEINASIGTRLVFLKAKKLTSPLGTSDIESLLDWSNELSSRNPELTGELNRRLTIFLLKNFNSSCIRYPQVSKIAFSFVNRSLRSSLTTTEAHSC